MYDLMIETGHRARFKAKSLSDLAGYFLLSFDSFRSICGQLLGKVGKRRSFQRISSFHAVRFEAHVFGCDIDKSRLVKYVNLVESRHYIFLYCKHTVLLPEGHIVVAEFLIVASASSFELGSL